MENLGLKELRNLDTNKVASHFASMLSEGKELKNVQIQTIISAFITYKMQKNDELDSIDAICSEIENSAISEIIRRHNAEYIQIAKKSINIFTSYELLSFILFDNSFESGRDGSCSTPSGILKLANKILDIKEDDKVLELCSGKGNFFVEMSINSINANYTGIELNYIQKDIAELRSYLIGKNYEYILSDALEYRNKTKVDKIFANYPFALRGYSIDECKKELQKKLNLPKEVIQRASSDWVFNLLTIEQLKDNGKAVVVMTNGGAWNESDKNIRQYFVEQGYVETVVSLPTRLFNTTAIPTVLMVLSKGNKEVKLVDAKDLFQNERRINVLTDKNIETILNSISDESDISLTKTIDELEKNEFILNASRYFEIVPEIKDGIKLETLIKNITRGSQIKAEVLDKYKSDKPTNNQYLLLANINDGILSINNEDQYLTEIPDNMSRYIIKNNSIILSKIGTPTFKSAVAQIDEGKQIIANGNLFVIEVDEEKVNPFYIQAFFASNLGNRIFKSIYTGGALPTINLEKLKNMIIPYPSLEKQTEISNKYAASMDELILLNRKIEKTKYKMKHIFDEEELTC